MTFVLHRFYFCVCAFDHIPMLKCAIEVSNIIIIITIIIIISWLCNMVLNCSLVCSIWEYITAFFARLQFTTVPLWCSYHYHHHQQQHHQQQHHHRQYFCYYYLHHKDLYCIIWLIISFSWKKVPKDIIPCMEKIHCSWHFVPCFYLSCCPVEDIRQIPGLTL